jgi:sugar O-acyltransferase (sialic acid O-acetyltransferase NeuD family)
MEDTPLAPQTDNVIIVGAGGLARILFDALDQQGIQVCGFLDSREELFGQDYLGTPVLGSPLTYFDPHYQYISAVGDPKLKRQLLASLVAKSARFFSPPNRFSGSEVTCGTGNFITPGASISHHVELGNHIYIDTSVIVGHDVIVEDYGTIGAMVFIAGDVHLGPEVAVHPKATIAKGVKVGARATIGIGSVVLWDVPEGETVFGNPARVISP